MKRKAKIKKLNKRRITHAKKGIKIGNIFITSIEGRKEREINIPPNAKLSNVVELAMSLLVEGGILEDVNGNELLIINTILKNSPKVIRMKFKTTTLK